MRDPRPFDGILCRDPEKNVVTSRKNDCDRFPDESVKFLQTHGDEIIVGMKLVRSYFPEIINDFANMLQSGEPSEKFFHMLIVLQLSNGREMVVQRAETIFLSFTYQIGQHDDCLEIPNVPKASVKQYLSATEAKMGTHAFFSYEIATNNCQTFAREFLLANGITFGLDWVSQDTVTCLKRHPILRKVLDGVVKIADDIDLATGTACITKDM